MKPNDMMALVNVMFYTLLACFIPIDALHQVKDPILLSGDFEAGWLFHIQLFVLWEDTIQKGGLNVKLVKFPAKRGSDVSNGTKRLKQAVGAVVLS